MLGFLSLVLNYIVVPLDSKPGEFTRLTTERRRRICKRGGYDLQSLRGPLSGAGSLPPFFRPSAHKLHSEVWQRSCSRHRRCGQVHSQVWSIQQSEVQVRNCLVVLVWCIVPGERHCVCNRSFNTLFALNEKSVGPRGNRDSLGRFVWRSQIKIKGQVVP